MAARAGKRLSRQRVLRGRDVCYERQLNGLSLESLSDQGNRCHFHRVGMRLRQGAPYGEVTPYKVRIQIKEVTRLLVNVVSAVSVNKSGWLLGRVKEGRDW
jgi:hypothetical protein